jgi:multidrug efflux pump subunit AcrB
MIASTLLVDTAVGRILPSLPAGTQYNVRRMDPTVFPIISYALVSDRAIQHSCRIWRDIRSRRCFPRSLVSPGSAFRAATPRRSRCWPIPAARRSRPGDGDLATAIRDGNVLSAVGQVQDRGRLSLVIADRSVASAAQIGDIVVKAAPAGVVRVRDVATVQDGAVPVWQRIVEDGKPAVLFNIYEQPDGNAVQIARQVQAKLAGVKLPAGSGWSTGTIRASW